MEDVGDGTYDMIYVPWHPGQYRVELGYCDPDVQHDEVIPIKGSPWTTAFDDPWSKVVIVRACVCVDGHMRASILCMICVAHALAIRAGQGERH